MTESRINIILPSENELEAEEVANALKEMNPGEQQALLNYIRAFQDGANYARRSVEIEDKPKTA